MDIKQIRDQCGLSQAELADLLGVTQSAVSRLESGTIPISKRTLLALEVVRQQCATQRVVGVFTNAASQDTAECDLTTEQVHEACEQAALERVIVCDACNAPLGGAIANACTYVDCPQLGGCDAMDVAA